MAIMDNEVQTTMDAFRSNPNALMQRFQRSQQLIDLLALQKLKSEKEAAARQMQMQMQQNPNTIKEQREKEVLDMTKNELIQQTSGLMALNNARRQNNLKKVASAGITGRPAPNMRTMADGGIVGFQPGGSVLDKLIQEKIAEIMADKNLGPEEKRAAIAKLREPKAQPEGIQKVLGDKLIADQTYDDQVMGLGMGASKGDTIPLIPGSNVLNRFQKDTPIGQLAQRNIANIASQIGGPEVDTTPDPFAIGKGKIPPDRKGGDSVIEGIPGLVLDDEEKPDEKKITAPDAGIAAIAAPTVEYDSPLGKIRDEVKKLKEKDATYGLQDLDKVRKKGRDEFTDATKDIIPGLESIQRTKQSDLEQLIAGKEKFYEDIQDPDKLRDRQLRAALAGAAGQATFGTTGAGITRASLAEEKAQEDFKVKGFQDIFGDKKALIKEVGKDKADIIGKSFEITKGAFDIGEKRGKTAAVENAAAKTARARLDSTVLNAISKDAEMFYKQDVDNATFKQRANIAHAKLMSQAADREVKVDIANLQAELGRQKNALLAEANKIKSAASLRTFRTTLFTGTQKIIADLKSKYQKVYLKAAEDAKLNPGGAAGEKRAKELIAQMNAFIKSDTASLQAVTNGIIKDLEKDISGGGGTTNMDEVDKILGIK
tara:strand:- start:167 stop:2134 length:1968 start_codon:yes stop_codon:yes gene_type:complete